MAYENVIVIFAPFAKKNEDKIAFEKRKKICKVMPLFYPYIPRNMKKIIVLSFLAISVV